MAQSSAGLSVPEDLASCNRHTLRVIAKIAPDQFEATASAALTSIVQTVRAQGGDEMLKRLLREVA